MINLGLSRTSSCKVYNEIAQNDNSQKLQKNWAIMQYMIFVSIFEVAKNDNLEKMNCCKEWQFTRGGVWLHL